MAIELIARVLSQPRDVLDASEKMVMVVLADRADQDGVCWYSIGSLCDLTSFTRKAVQRIAGRLEAKGLLSKMRRSQKTNFWRIAVDKLPLHERKKTPGEKGLQEWIEQEPDLFGVVGDRRTPTGNEGDLGTRGGRPSDASGGDRGTPDSLNDPLEDPLTPVPLDEMIVHRWNELAAQHGALQPFRGQITAGRQRKINSRPAEFKHWNGPYLSLETAKIEDAPRRLWSHVFDVISTSRLLTGQKIDWAPGFDWMLGPKNFTKIMEGNYGHGHDRIGTPSTNPGDRSAVEAGRAALELVRGAKERRRNQGAGGYPGRAASAGS